MKSIYSKLLASMFCLLFAIEANSQVTGLSYTIAPTVEYNWFSDSSGLKNGFLGGAQVGFGFGEFVELRANYQRGFDLQTDITKFGIENAEGFDSTYSARAIELSRYGGELKLNLSRGAFLPYLTVGTGIQEMEADSLGNNKQIFLTTGLGIKFSAANRYTIGLQALRTSYRSNSINTFMDAQEKELYGLEDADVSNSAISNYALRASLVFYLGGRKPGSTSAVDKAYFDNFSGGFRGLSIPIEPTVMKVNFHEDLGYRSTWMAGLSAGVDVGPLIGVRGFYWRALEDGKTTDFDQLAMYGGEARFKLNEGKGFTPWVTIGGGQIDAADDYLGRDSLAVEDRAFAMGGLGVDLPFTKYFKATGYVRSIVTSAQATSDVAMPDDLKDSWSYGVSLNFILGKKPKKVKNVQQDAIDRYLLAEREELGLASQQLKSEYDAKIEALERELEEAVENKDIDAVKDITEQKEIAEEVRSTISAQKSNNSSTPNGQSSQPNNGNSVIQMTPSEFQLLLREILDGNKGSAGTGYSLPAGVAPAAGEESIEDAIGKLKVEQELADLKEAIDELQDDNKTLQEIVEELEEKESDIADDLEDLMKDYNDKINDLYKSQSKIEEGLQSKEAMINVESIDSKKLNRDLKAANDRIDNLEEMLESGNFESSGAGNTTDDVKKGTSNTSRVAVDEELRNKKGNFAKLRYQGMSGFAGFGIGGSATFNVGYRLHYAIGDSSNVHFVPEAFFGLGSPSSFGLMANLIQSLPFLTKTDMVNPYLGLGVGLMKVGDSEDADQLKGAYNFIVGSTLNVWKGDLYVDYTARNLFKYNQLIVGYRFPF